MTQSPVPPIDYSTADYHHSFSISIHLFCTCDLCRGLFKHTHIPYSNKPNNCKSLKKIEGTWICIHCEEHI